VRTVRRRGQVSCARFSRAHVQSLRVRGIKVLKTKLNTKVKGPNPHPVSPPSPAERSEGRVLPTDRHARGNHRAAQCQPVERMNGVLTQQLRLRLSFNPHGDAVRTGMWTTSDCLASRVCLDPALVVLGGDVLPHHPKVCIALTWYGGSRRAVTASRFRLCAIRSGAPRRTPTVRRFGCRSWTTRTGREHAH